LNLAKVTRYPLPQPPLAEQAEIVRRVDQLFFYADRLEGRLRPRCWPRPFAASWCRKTRPTRLLPSCSSA